MRKILVVDDEFLVRIGIKALIDWESYGYQIVGEAADGKEALEKISQLEPDVVLTDLKMDGMDGFDLIATCKKTFPAVKFIVLSVFDDAENVKRAMKLGAVDYVFKLKLNPEELLAILDELDYETGRAEEERFARKNISDVKRLLMRLAAERDYKDFERLERTFAEFGLPVNFRESYCVLMLRYDSCAGGAEKKKNDKLLEDAVGNMVQNVLGEELKLEVCGYSDQCLISVINPGDSDGYSALRLKIEERFPALCEYGVRYANIRIRGALSPVFQGIRKFADAVFCCEKAFSLNAGQTEGLCVYQGEVRSEIMMLKQFISENLSRNFMIRDAADYCNMSESYFAHVFKEETGLSFIEYVTRQRIRKARELLEKTDLPVWMVAQEVGIENPNYFSVVFSKICKESPSEYRSRFRFEKRQLNIDKKAESKR